MKHLFLSSVAALAVLASCSEINTDPAPARFTRATTTAAVTYSITAPRAGTTDTALVNPRVLVYVVNPIANADGSNTYPATASLQPVATLAPTTTTQTFTVPGSPFTPVDGQLGPVVRLVLTSDNYPGRRSTGQQLTGAVLVNGTSRSTATLRGTAFSRTATSPFSVVAEASPYGY